jgi:hypothetical protein
MKLRLCIVFTAIAFLTSTLHAQHEDIEFGYDDTSSPTAFDFSPLPFDAVTADGFDVLQSNFEALDPFVLDDFAADQPGFATNAMDGLVVNSGDGILITVVDASVESSFGVGFVNFYNPGSDKLEATGRIAFEDNTNSTDDLVLNGTSIESGDLPQFIDIGDSGGDIHDHIKWDLLDDDTASIGAYGILVQLQSDFSPRDGVADVTSDPFWLVFNRGMSVADFETLALPKFGVGIPAQVAGLELNVGEEQRSAIETLTVSFDSEVTIAEGAFSLVQRSTATEETFDPVTISVNEQVVDNQTQVTIMFESHVRDGGDALVDGNYQLTVESCLVSNEGTPMMEDMVFGAVESDAFFTFYGDFDGNRTVNVFDLLSFRQAFASSVGDPNYSFFIDFNADGNINVFDLLPFRMRFLETLPFTFGSAAGKASFTGSPQGTVKSVTTVSKKATAAPKKRSAGR